MRATFFPHICMFGKLIVGIVFGIGLVKYFLDVVQLDVCLKRFRLNAWLKDTACIPTSWSFSQNHKHFYLSPAGCSSFSHLLSPDRPSSPCFFPFQCAPHASHEHEQSHEPYEKYRVKSKRRKQLKYSFYVQK